ncbi:MAG: DMT family transporter [Proteobacteria bacterium]|nr:DMT family transporter [Pseudomonadota bacterium]
MLNHNKNLYFLLLAVVLIWGINWPMNRIGMDYMPALWHSAIRMIVGCGFMFLLVTIRGQLTLPGKQELPLIFIIGILQLALFTSCINLGLQHVNPGRSAILVYTVPLFATPIAILFLNEKLNRNKLMGLILGFLGIMILFSPWDLTWSVEMLYGHGILLCAAILFAIAICCTKNMQSSLSPLQLLPWQLLVGAVLALIFALIDDPNPTIEWSQPAILAMIYTGILAAGIAYWLITIVGRKLPAITVSLGLLGVPLTGVISSHLILDEPITASMKIAMLLIFTGLLFVALEGRTKTICSDK